MINTNTTTIICSNESFWLGMYQCRLIHQCRFIEVIALWSWAWASRSDTALAHCTSQTCALVRTVCVVVRCMCVCTFVYREDYNGRICNYVSVGHGQMKLWQCWSVFESGQKRVCKGWLLTVGMREGGTCTTREWRVHCSVCSCMEPAQVCPSGAFFRHSWYARHLCWYSNQYRQLVWTNAVHV